MKAPIEGPQGSVAEGASSRERLQGSVAEGGSLRKAAKSGDARAARGFFCGQSTCAHLSWSRLSLRKEHERREERGERRRRADKEEGEKEEEERRP